MIRTSFDAMHGQTRRLAPLEEGPRPARQRALGAPKTTLVDRWRPLSAWRVHVAVALAVGLILGGLVAAPASAGGGVTARVSLHSDGQERIGASQRPVTSADGRFVAFVSDAPLTGQALGTQVFVRDRLQGSTTLVSSASDGTPANGMSSEPSISADGRHVAFSSLASNLVAGDNNGVNDVFLRDRHTGVTVIVSATGDGTPGTNSSGGPSVSADGAFVAFTSRAGNLTGIQDGQQRALRYETATNLIVPASPPANVSTGSSYMADAISADGRYVAITGSPGWPAPLHIHRYDVDAQVAEMVSRASDGTHGNSESRRAAMSDDGRYIAFYSFADNLVAGDTNGFGDVFVRDMASGTTTRVSVASDGAQASSWSDFPAISRDGQHVSFASEAANLVAGDTNALEDVFVHNRLTGATIRASVASGGAQGNHISRLSALAQDGRYVFFDSLASNLVTDDTNGRWDVFVRDQGGPDAPPSVSITAPVDGATVSGRVAVTATAADDAGVVQVAFYAGAVPVGIDTDGSDGWSVTWDTTTSGDGVVQLTATATDTAGQTGSDGITVTVDNAVASTTAPVAAFAWTCTSNQCTFEDRSTDADGDIQNWSWDHGDGTGYSGGGTHTHLYLGAKKGSQYTVRLTVTDASGATSSVSARVRPHGSSGAVAASHPCKGGPKHCG